MTPPSPDPEPVAAEALTLENLGERLSLLPRFATSTGDYVDVENVLDEWRMTLDAARSAPPITATDPLRGSDRSMAEHSDTRSHCLRCGEWRDSPTSDCANCGLTEYPDDPGIGAALPATARLRAIEAAARDVMAEWDELGPTGTHSTIGAHHALRAALAALPVREDGPTGIDAVAVVAGALKGTYQTEFPNAKDDDWRADAEFVLARFQEYGAALDAARSAPPITATALAHVLRGSGIPLAKWLPSGVAGHLTDQDYVSIAADILDAARSAPPITATDGSREALIAPMPELRRVVEQFIADNEGYETRGYVDLTSLRAALPVREDGPTGIDE